MTLVGCWEGHSRTPLAPYRGVVLLFLNLDV